MAWRDAVDGYCERLVPGYWAEPVNAVTNMAFLVAAALVWRRTAGLPLARAMALVLAAIGVGSYLFHTHANRVTGLMDVIPILLFILLYVFAASRDFLGMTPWQAGLATAAFLPYAAATVPLWSMIPGLGSSAGYAPVPVLILAYAWLLRRRAPATARGLAAGAGLLILSLGFRTLDGPLCAVWPMGTHFLWHLLNALMLGWMITVYVAHREPQDRTGQAGATGFRRCPAALFLVQPADPSRGCLLIALLPTPLSPRPGLTLPGAVGVGLAANAAILAVLLAG